MNTRQSIETRYISPTNTLGGRIVATTASGHRLIHYWDYGLGIEANHYAAAKALQAKLDWEPIVAGGSTKAGFVWLTSTLDDTAHKLQTAAPDLLASLEELCLAPNKHRPEEYWEAARAAIAKAKGE